MSNDKFDDFAEDSYADADESSAIPLEDLKIPDSAPKAAQNLKPKMPSLMEITRTKIDMDAIRNVSAKVSQKVELILHKKDIDRMVRSAPDELKPLKLVQGYKTSPPCGSKWDDANEERVRFCERCQLRVYDFQDMDQTEAEEVVRKMEGLDKPQLFKRSDGKFLSKACPVGQRIGVYKVVPFAVSLVLFCLVGAVLWLTPSARLVPENVSPTATDQQPTLGVASSKAAVSPTAVTDSATRKKLMTEYAINSRTQKVVAILEHDEKQIKDVQTSRALPVPGGAILAHSDAQTKAVEESFKEKPTAK